jgi:hypothetical protein
MKRLFSLPFLLFFCFTSSAQIKNSGFEISRDTLAGLPNQWDIRKENGFKFRLDNQTKYQGKNSFVISSELSDTGQYTKFSQHVSAEIATLKRISITAFIKTQDVQGTAGLFCRLFDQNNKELGFANSFMQNIVIRGNADWKQYSLVMIVNTNCKKITLGGFLQGRGIVWFDNFSLEDVSVPNTPPSKVVKKYVKNVCRLVKKHSIYSDSLNWMTLHKELDFLSKGMSSMKDASILGAFVLGKLSELGDNHSSILSKSYAIQYKTQNNVSSQPTGKMLAGGIGYISVPAFLSTNKTAARNFAQTIQDLIKKLDTENEVKGWVVDLRQDRGGNMYPMIAGLGPLLDNGTSGYFVHPKSKRKVKWFYANGHCGSSIFSSVKLKYPYFPKNKTAKIAVLIGEHTASSGEMTAISFIGKPNTKLFGQHSAGYTTGNEMYKLPGSSVLNLADSFIADRNSKRYVEGITPDELVVGETETVLIAGKWIEEKP